MTQKQASVSTHSRLKAAGVYNLVAWFEKAGFNTQPPEGGWSEVDVYIGERFLFQHTAA